MNKLTDVELKQLAKLIPDMDTYHRLKPFIEEKASEKSNIIIARHLYNIIHAFISHTPDDLWFVPDGELVPIQLSLDGTSQTPILYEALSESFASHLTNMIQSVRDKQYDMFTPLETQHEENESQWYQAHVIPIGQNVLIVMKNIQDQFDRETILYDLVMLQTIILESIPDLIFQFDVDGNYEAVLSADKLLLIEPNADLVGHNLREYFTEDHANMIIDMFKTASQTEMIQELTYPLDLVHGKFWFEARIIPMQTGSVLTLIRDITEKQIMADALQSSEKRHRSIIESMTEGVIVCDKDLNLQTINHSAYQLFKVNPKDHAHITLKALFESVDIRDEHGYDMKFEHLPIFYTIEKGLPVQNRVCQLVHDEQVTWITVNVQPLFSHNHTKPHSIITTFTDITAIREAEQKAFAIAIERERHDILTQFIESVSHEFRTPLSVIRMSLDLIQRLDDKQKQLRHIERSNSQIDNLIELVEDMLFLATFSIRAETQQSQIINVKALIEQCIDNTATLTAPRQQIIEFKTTSNAIATQGHQDFLQLAIEHILKNASLYSPNNTKITVQVSQNQQNVLIWIEDHGMGIDVKDLPHVYDRFWRKDTAHQQKGMGLGLAIVRDVIRYHDGFVSMKSEVNQGTTVTVRLPHYRG